MNKQGKPAYMRIESGKGVCGKVFGVLDIDSQMISRFDESDEEGLSSIIGELENVADFSGLLKNG